MGSRLVQSLAAFPACVLLAAQAGAQLQPPQVLVSPDRSRILLMEPTQRAPGAGASTSAIEVAGLRIDPRSGADPEAPTWSALVVQPIGRGEIRRLVVPWKARVNSAFWSPDGSQIAVTMVEETGTSLWVANPSSGEIRPLAGPVLSAAGRTPCQWLPSGDALLCTRRTRSSEMAGAAAADRLDGGPGDATRNSGEEAKFERLLQSQLVVIPLTGDPRSLGSPGIHGAVTISPDGRFLLVERRHPPFGAGAMIEQLPVRSEVLALPEGKLLKVVHDRVAEPALSGPRTIHWRGDQPATLAWFESGGSGAGTRDALLQLAAPFTAAPARLASFEHPMRSVSWGRGNVAIVHEASTERGISRGWVLNPSANSALRPILGQSGSDGVLTELPGGKGAFATADKGRYALLAGLGERPYLDRIDLSTGKTSRLWRSEGPEREVPLMLFDGAQQRVITRREWSDGAEYLIRDLWKRGAQAVVPLTKR